MRVKSFGKWMNLLILLPLGLSADCEPDASGNTAIVDPPCPPLENVTVFGIARDARNVAGGASTVNPAQLDEFASTDVVRALRRVPGASFQLEDGYGLRPNISIRGTPTERSSRITLLEDNVLIAPAPYAAPAAYYFPTFGRIHSMEVLKGPSAITQGPYTIGGAINLVSTPLPDSRQGLLQAEAGADATWRTHAMYGDSGSRIAWLVETHQWQSDGFQDIDRHDTDTGLAKEDYLAKISIASDAAARTYQRLQIKLQSSEEDSNQTYMGLTDTDFRKDALRRYGLSALDNMHNEHEQIMLRWFIEPDDGGQLVITAYDNRFKRAWYKTEGIDFDGSDNAGVFSRTGWSSVIDAVNTGHGMAGFSTRDLQAVLDGADTRPGAIQVRNNSRRYNSRGLQADFSHAPGAADSIHNLQYGVRYHEDEEDRLQRNDSYQQLGGTLVLSDHGLEGNAGNRIQKAEAWAAYVQDRIEMGRWVLTPGIRFESISQTRIDFGADPAVPDGRGPADVKRIRSNKEDVWIPGLGVIYELSDHTRLIAGAHRGFSAPGNREGIEAEKSINYEAGFRHENGSFEFEAMAFFNDYDNLQGVCTASSGSDCEVGDVFNGNAVSVPGLEIQFGHDLSASSAYQIPLVLTYTWMNARFESDIANSEYFGNVRRGDSVPYVPDHQAFLSIGLETGPWSTYISGNYTDTVCTQASCGALQRTDSGTVIDLGVHFRVSQALELYTVVENLTAQLDIVARQPYGARPGKDRTWLLGAKLDF
jgi:Fe(3+) dicitrate transport protein